MTSPIFGNQPQPGNQGIFGLIKQLRGGNSQAIFDQMYQSNPQFRDFANSMKGKTPEEAFKEKGFDYSKIKNLM